MSNSLPTRYWVALRITNNTASLFTNTIALRVTNVLVKGTNGGIVDSIVALANPGNQTSRVDQLQVWADASTLTNTNAVVRVKQGSFDNMSMKISISNADPDATNFLTGMAITNEGTAGLQDLGFFKVFLDNGDGVFNAADDLVFAGAMDSNQCYRLSIAVPNTMTGTATKTFWGTYDVKYSGRIGQTVRLKLLSGTNFVWNDGYNTSDFSADQSDPRPVVLGSPVVPTSNATQVITPSSAQTFDFTVSSGSYLPLPTSFTTNQLVPVASFGLAMDTEHTNGTDYSNVALPSQVFRGIQVQLASSNALAGISGFAYLYRDADTNGALGASDTLVASNAVTAGAGFTISNFF
ncbi:MAG: hypothetical protein JNM63_08650, partial [Spirochaetia bacterium]|nr:hypothetical protein [Spirochaetia bacterium]